MSLIAMVFGALLVLLGGGLYFESRAPTALIPAYFGIALVVLGILARSDKLRMHAMHVAALLGLIGFAMPGYMVIKGLVIDGKEFSLSLQGQAVMSVLCLVFLGLCVKSFIDSRRARRASEAQGQQNSAPR